MSHSADHNLLFGILAVQMDFISRDHLIAAMNAWVLDKNKPLGAILVKQQVLSPERHTLLQALVQEHLKQHENDLQQSLAAISSVDSVKMVLEQIADPEVQRSLVQIAVARAKEEDSCATVSFSIGTPSSAGTRFRILRPHAKGGLGQVYVAQDEELHREVALKEIQERHADNQDSRSRFLLEAEITGGLEHPGIVPVYGLGQYADGRPFYAMRFIKGDSLKHAIERFHDADVPGRDPSERALELRKLLGRFIDVCQAIQYAHDRGVLHRDLKPGNIMLGKYGETLVVDWGLAKVAGRQGDPAVSATGMDEPTLRPASASGSAETLAGSAVGTPAFMSPEQAVGRLDQIGPTSDVYSLGATLYCLLTGAAPVKDKDVDVVLNKVRHGDFPKPRQLKPDIDLVLEAICTKAMALHPADRYASPRALADDIERWLADEPVSAYREPLWTRLARWRRRHRTMVAALSAALVVLLAAAVSFGWWYQQERTQQAAKLAEQQREQVRRLAKVEQEVAVAVQEATTLADRAGTMTDRPHLWESTLAAARNAVQLAETLLAREGETVEPALRQKIAAARTRVEAEEKDRRLVAGVDESFVTLAEVDVKASEFKASEAYAKLQTALAAYGLPLGGLPVSEAAAKIKACPGPIQTSLLTALEYCSGFAAKKDVAKRNWCRAVLAGADDDPWRSRLRSAVARQDAAALKWLVQDAAVAKQPPVLLARMATRFPEGAAASRLELARRSQEAHPGDYWANLFVATFCIVDKAPQWAQGARFYTAALALRPDSGVAYLGLGLALAGQGDLPAAARAYRQAIELLPNTADTYANLALVHQRQHDLAGALKLTHKAIELDANEANLRYSLGILLEEAHDLPGAVKAYQKAVDLAPNYAEAYLNLSRALINQQDLTGALKASRKAIELRPKYAMAYVNLGSALLGQNDSAGAIKAYQKAIDLDPRIAMAYHNLGVVFFDRNEFANSIKYSRKAVDLDPKYAFAHVTLGNALGKQKDLEGAIQSYRKAIELDPQFALPHYNLGMVLHEKKDTRGAIQAFRQAVALNFQHAETPNLYNNLGVLLVQQGEIAEAVASMKQAVKLYPLSNPRRAALVQELKLLQRLAGLEGNLAHVLNSKVQPASNTERADYATLCAVKQLNLASARLFEQAFAAEPKLLDELEAGYRYSAACAAALLAAGQGKDAANPDAQERSRRRKQALDWLRADLTLWAKILADKDTPSTRAAVRQKLRHWQGDSDLAGIRDAGALGQLSEEERTACRRLWADVGELLKKAR